MYYILDQNYALRGWKSMPCAVVSKDPIKVISVKKPAFEILRRCDGKTDIPPNRIISELLRDGIVKQSSPEEYSLSAWQSYTKFENFFFPSVSWGITDKCNLRCRHCFNNSVSTDNVSEFSTEESDVFLDEAARAGVQTIALTGGEPFLQRDILSLIQKTIDLGMHVIAINTNGLLLSPESLAKLTAMGCRCEFKISFDGLGTHDWMRNHMGAEEQTKRAIRLCVEAGFPVTVQMNVHRGNLHTLLSTACMLQEIGVGKMRVIRTADAPGWRFKDLTLQFLEYFDAMLQFVEEYKNRSWQMDLDIWHFLTLDVSKRQFWITPIRHGYDTFSMCLPVCESNRNMVSVAADGEVYPCHPFSGFYRAIGISLGNVKTTPLTDILKGGKYIGAVCETLEELANRNDTCGRCRYFAVCCGGCRAMATLYGGGYESNDPMMCAFFQNQYVEKIQRILIGWEDRTPHIR